MASGRASNCPASSRQSASETVPKVWAMCSVSKYTTASWVEKALDTYGGYSRHGGGAFSGKDPTKVDRSAAYAARYVAKNIVAAGLASKCEVQLAYAIGVAKPVSVMVDTFGTGKISDEEISAIIDKVFDLRPAAIIDTLKLRAPIYRQLAAYGHVGREDLDVQWEKTDKVAEIKALANI